MDDTNRFLDKSIVEYFPERDRFYKELFEFHRNRRTPFHALPTVSGKPVDLYLLYSLVAKYGGFHKISDQFLWYKLNPVLFHFPESCANTELALKQLYMRYLYAYERVHIHGDDPDHEDEEVESSGQRTGRKSGGRILVHQVPLKYNYKQHVINSLERRERYGLSTNFVKSNRYERLEKSLLSGLLNEVDFAINVCSLLSMDTSDPLRLRSRPHILHLLLAHVGLLSESLQIVYEQEWVPRTRRDFIKFWFETTDKEDIDYSSTILDMISNPSSSNQHAHSYLTDKAQQAGENVLHLGRDNHSSDVIFTRVKQVANIIRNLSFEVINAQTMVESELCFKFIMLCCHNTSPQLKSAGLDTLTNISSRFVMRPIHEPQSQLIFNCINHWIYSKDKLEIVNSLLLISGLTQVEDNEELLSQSLTVQSYERMFNLARISDLQLIISVLDVLYYLSELGEVTCDNISAVPYSISFLVDMLTVETVSFGQSALGGIAVTEQSHQNRPMMAPPPIRHMGPPLPSTIPQPMHRPLNPQFQQRPMIPVTVQGQHQQRPVTSTNHHLDQKTLPVSITPRPSTPVANRNTPPVPFTSIAPKPPLPGSPRPLINLPMQLGFPNSQRMMIPGGQPINTQAPPAAPSNQPINAQSPPGFFMQQPIRPPMAEGMLPATAQNLAVMNPEQVVCNWMRANYEIVPGNTLVLASLYKDYCTWLSRRSSVPPISQAAFVAAVKRVFSMVEFRNDGMVLGIRWKPPPGMTMPPGALGSASNQGVNQGAPTPRPGSTPYIPRAMSPRGPPQAASPLASSSGSDLSLPTSKPIRKRRRSSQASQKRSSTPPAASPAAASQSATSSLASPAASPRSPVSASSPPNLELQVCGKAEPVKTIDEKAAEARIERIENPKSPAAAAAVTKRNDIPTQSVQQNQQTIPQSSKSFEESTILPALLNGPNKENKTKQQTQDIDLDSTNKTNNLITQNLTVDTTESGSAQPKDAETNDESRLNKECVPANGGITSPEVNGNGDHIASNGHGGNSSISPPSTLDSPKPVCNGHVEESKSLTQNIVDSGDALPPKKAKLNGLVNGITDLSKLTEKPRSKSKRTHSGDSLGSHASTSTMTSHSSTNNQEDQPLKIQTTTLEHPYVIDLHSPNPKGLKSPVQRSKSTELKSPQPKRKRKSRSRHSSAASTTNTEPVTPPQSFPCGWEGCSQGFGTGPLLRRHVSLSHTHQEGTCMWSGCDKIARKRWALVSHVSERHTNDTAIALARRMKVVPQSGQAAPPIQPATPAIVSAQAARIAILRTAPKPPYPDFMDPREGPVTKHIRFTSALIIRNVSRYSSKGRTFLKRHESHLTSVAGSSMEASVPILNVLWELQQSH